MGIPVLGPVYVRGDNQSVLANTTFPESTLKKKNQSIAYHFVREGVARDQWRASYVNTHDNEADLLTKLLPAGGKQRGFVCRMLHHIYRSGPYWYGYDGRWTTTTWSLFLFLMHSYFEISRADQ